MAAALTVSNEELRSARQTMQTLGQMLNDLESGDVKKYVITQQNQMRGVLVSVEEYAELQRLRDVEAD
jgi:PHD/YefM family antitoxin component YafN of YafNO toxin-antitoxin module